MSARGLGVLVAACLGALAASGCAADVPSCLPGAIAECACGGPFRGTQVCGADGTFGACSCTCDGGTCGCVLQETRACACEGEPGVEVCRESGWGPCQCISSMVDGCESCEDCTPPVVPVGGPIVGAELVRTTSRLIAIVPGANGLLVALTRSASSPYELLRFRLTDGAPPQVVSFPRTHPLLGVADRGARLELAFDDHLESLDPVTLETLDQRPLEPPPDGVGMDRCVPLEGCGLWLCLARQQDGPLSWVVYDGRGRVRAVRPEARPELVVVPGRLAVVADGYVRFDLDGLPRPRPSELDPASLSGAAIVGAPGHTLVTTDGVLADLRGCPSDPTPDGDCLGARGRLELGEALRALGATSDRLVALTAAGELVEVDPSTTRVLARRAAPEGAEEIQVDARTGAVIVTTVQCSDGECIRAVHSVPWTP